MLHFQIKKVKRISKQNLFGRLRQSKHYEIH